MAEKFIDNHEFLMDYSQKDQKYVILGFIKYQASDHFTRLCLGQEEDEKQNDYLKRIFNICLEAITELEIKVFNRDEEKNLEDYKSLKDQKLLITDKNELLKYGFCGNVLNGFFSDFAAGADLGNL